MKVLKSNFFTPHCNSSEIVIKLIQAFQTYFESWKVRKKTSDPETAEMTGYKWSEAMLTWYNVGTIFII